MGSPPPDASGQNRERIPGGGGGGEAGGAGEQGLRSRSGTDGRGCIRFGKYFKKLLLSPEKTYF